MSNARRSAKPPKRARLGANHRAYHDEIPLPNEFDMIYSSEGTVRNIGGVQHSSRRQHSAQPIAGAWENLTGWLAPDDPELALDPDGDQYNEVLDAEVMYEPPPVQKQKKKSVVLYRPHVVWKDQYRQSYLDEILRWAGRGDFIHSRRCPDCLSKKVVEPGIPEIRCRDCFSPDLICTGCCVKRHRNQPLHRVQKWTGEAFIEVSLRSLGVVVQLNHSSGYCENPVPCHANMLVLHVNGIHSVDIQYCGCARAIPHHIQLLRRRLYPASQLFARTCATFELLRHLHKLALTTKASTYDFYRCLEKSTVNTGLNVPKNRYRAFFRIILQWRHLQALKWGGRGHDVTGVAGTQHGELALKCPTCPHPGINLPENWRDVPDEIKFIYAVFATIDANFRLKSQLVSNYSQDPGLGDGWAYMIPRKPYEAYVLSRANDEDKSTCVGFQALAQANTKFSTGLRYTGVGAVVCGRSEMIMPLGVGNLQKGERYANMDYIFGMVFQALLVSMVLVSYDICCQWFINLFRRMEDIWPEEIKRTGSNITIIPAIPKLHESMHTRDNHQVYSFNFIPGVGQTDGECIERVWASHNILGNATKTQGPGSRADTLDDHFAFWNWSKYTSLDKTLLKRYKNAIGDRNTQLEGFWSLTSTLDSDVVARWEAMCQDWENEAFPKVKKNPYHTPSTTISEAQVKRDLANSEAQFLSEGGSFPHATTASMFVCLGLEIEESQRRLRRLAKATQDHTTTRREGSLTEERNLLIARIRAWEQISPIYMPGLLQYQLDNPDESRSTCNVEDQKLWFPSSIPEPHRSRITVPPMVQIEGQLRMAQMSDALNSIRQILKVKARMVKFKNKNIRGQREGTRSRTVIDRVHERARNAAAKYREARIAHLALGGPGDWENVFQILADSDIRGYQDPNQLRVRVGRRGTFEDGQDPGDTLNPNSIPEGEFELFNEVRTRRDGTGETRRTLSWIWTVSMGIEEDEQGGDEVLRSEWAKSRARAMRAKEEVILLKEEMRRAIAFFEWKACWWTERKNAIPQASRDRREAIDAYSISQAKIYIAMASHLRDRWRVPLDFVEVVDPGSDTEDEGGSEDEEEESPAHNAGGM